MQYLICYDIADDRRRTRLSKALLNYGPRIQESVHWAELDADLAAELRDRIRAVIDEVEDRVHVVPLCQACSDKMEVFGNGERPALAEYYIV